MMHLARIACLTVSLAIFAESGLSLAGENPATFYGLDFSAYAPGQDPNLGAPLSVAQIRNRLQIVAPHTVWVRTFGSTRGMDHAPAIARSMGLKTAIGAWIGRGREDNAKEIANVGAAYRAGNVDLAIIGSEAILRGDATASEIVAYLNEARQANPGLLLGYADVYDRILANPPIVHASDLLLVNIYPYWEGVAASEAVRVLAARYARVIAAYPGKQVIISETGWPSRGEALGNAIPSPQNQALYIKSFIAWAKANNVQYFLFEAFDESWKVKYEGTRAGSWGVWDERGMLKLHLKDLVSRVPQPQK